MEGLAEHRSVLEHRPLPGVEAVEPSADDRLQRLRQCDLARITLVAVRRTVGSQLTRCGQHPDDLDCVEREPGRSPDDLADDLVLHAGDVLMEHLGHLGIRQGGQPHRHGAAVLSPPGRVPLQEIRAGQRHDEDRRVRGALHQLGDELDQPRVGPVGVLEHQDGRAVGGDVLEVGPHRGEQLGAVPGRHLRQAEQPGQSRLDPLAVLLRGHHLGDRGAQPGE